MDPYLIKNILINSPALLYIRDCGPQNHLEFITTAQEILLDDKNTPQKIALVDWLPFVHPDDTEIFCSFLANLEEDRVASCQYRLIFPDKSELYVRDSAKIVSSKIIGSLTDITEIYKLLNRLSSKLYRDQPTGLFNFEYIKDLIQDQITTDAAGDLVLLTIKIDQAKKIAEHLGIGVLDKTLLFIAQKLNEFAPAKSIIGRNKDDELLVLINRENSRSTAVALSEQFLLSIRKPLEIESREIFVNAFIGIAIASPRHTSPELLVMDSENAAIAAVNKIKSGYVIFSEQSSDSGLSNTITPVQLKTALENRDFQLFFQPIVSLKTGQIEGVEALIRWIHPEKGIIMPGDFMALANSSGIIQEIDAWVMEEACRQVKSWQDAGIISTDFTVNVNLSGRVLLNPHVFDMVKGVLEKTGIEPRSLKVELTEKLFLEANDQFSKTLEQIRKLGVIFQIDNFGTGYASLAYLQRYPINVVKIDRAFINGVDQKDGGAEIVRAIIELSKQMGMKTVAEGIETISQLHWLKEAQCDFGQGYLLYRPMDKVSAEQILKESRA